MAPWLRAYLLATAAPAAVIALLLLGVAPSAAGDPLLMAILVALGAIAANFPVMVTPRYKVDASPAIDLALIVLFSPALAVALVGLSRLLGDGILCGRRNPVTGNRRRQPTDLVFNMSQLMIAAAVGAIIFRGFTGGQGLGTGAAQLVGALAAAGAMYVVNTALVVIAAGIHFRRSPLQVWVEAASADFKQTAGLYATGYLLAVLSSGRPWLAIVMMAPVAAYSFH
jgi:hypothetical protein